MNRPAFESSAETAPEFYSLDTLYEVVQPLLETKREVMVEIASIGQTLVFRASRGFLEWRRESGIRWSRDDVYSTFHISDSRRKNSVFTILPTIEGITPKKIRSLERAHTKYFTPAQVRRMCTEQPLRAESLLSEARGFFKQLMGNEDVVRYFSRAELQNLVLFRRSAAPTFLREVTPLMKAMDTRVKEFWGTRADMVFRKVHTHIAPQIWRANSEQIRRYSEELLAVPPESVRIAELELLSITQAGSYKEYGLYDELMRRTGLSRQMVDLCAAGTLGTLHIFTRFRALAGRNGDVSIQPGRSLDTTIGEGTRSVHDVVGTADSGFDRVEWLHMLEKSFPDTSRREREELAEYVLGEDITEGQFLQVVDVIRTHSVAADSSWLFAQTKAIVMLNFDAVDPPLLQAITETVSPGK